MLFSHWNLCEHMLFETLRGSLVDCFATFRFEVSNHRQETRASYMGGRVGQVVMKSPYHDRDARFAARKAFSGDAIAAGRNKRANTKR